MPTLYERTCIQCKQTQQLVAVPRSNMCKKCQMVHKPLRLGTSRGWHLHPPTGYIIGRENGRQYYQHRWIMEQHLGRPLTRGETVHHINHIRTDNRLENLELISAGEHGLHHSEKRIRNALGQFKGVK